MMNVSYTKTWLGSSRNMAGLKTHVLQANKNDFSFVQKNPDLHKASQCMRHLAIPQVVLGFLATAAGIVTLLLGLVNPTFPYFVPADIVTGILSITAGGVAYRIHTDTKEDKKKKRTLTLMTLYGWLTLLCMSVNVLSLTLSAYVLFTCTDSSKLKAHCLTRTRPKLALAVINLIVETFILVTSLIVVWKSSHYKSTFIKQVPETHRPSKVERSSRFKPRPNPSPDHRPDVYIARCPSYRAHTHGQHVCIHCKHSTSRNGYVLPHGLPPPYTRVAPY